MVWILIPASQKKSNNYEMGKITVNGIEHTGNVYLLLGLCLFLLSTVVDGHVVVILVFFIFVLNLSFFVKIT